MTAKDFHALPAGTIVRDDSDGELGAIKRGSFGRNLVVWDSGCRTVVSMSDEFTGTVVKSKTESFDCPVAPEVEDAD